MSMPRERISKDIGLLIGGVGTLLIGLAAICTIFQVSGTLNEIFQIQEQAKDITRGVNDIKDAVKILDQARIKIDQVTQETAYGVNEIKQIVKSLAQMIGDNGTKGLLKNTENSSPAEVQRVVDAIPTSSKNLSIGEIFIPRPKKKALFETLSSKKSENKKKMEVEKMIKIKGINTDEK
ncbi:MAG: hypothetical protein HON43_00985 [Alphaproteobacteria bacterium]|nr:hypothetical protein [Alphaproteobacteria bacterium]MBT5390213.1 hypothetical protein [Alphaproteobacteria bacterium]